MLAVEPADVELAPLAVQTDATACPMSCGMPRFVASRFAVPAGRIASGTSDPATASRHRCTVPSPPQTKISSAPSSSACLTCFGAKRLFGTSIQSGSAKPCLLELVAQLVQAAAEGLARVRDDRDLRQPSSTRLPRDRREPAARLTSTIAASTATPTSDAAGDVERVVHAAVHAREGDEDRDRDCAAQIATCAARFRIGEVSEQGDPAVDGDRGRGVAGV